MYVGHYAPALLARALVPEARLPTLFLAAQALDFAFDTLVVVGVERIGVRPGVVGPLALDLQWMPWSHSLVAAGAVGDDLRHVGDELRGHARSRQSRNRSGRWREGKAIQRQRRYRWALDDRWSPWHLRSGRKLDPSSWLLAPGSWLLGPLLCVPAAADTPDLTGQSPAERGHVEVGWASGGGTAIVVTAPAEDVWVTVHLHARFSLVGSKRWHAGPFLVDAGTSEVVEFEVPPDAFLHPEAARYATDLDATVTAEGVGVEPELLAPRFLLWVGGPGADPSFLDRDTIENRYPGYTTEPDPAGGAVVRSRHWRRGAPVEGYHDPRPEDPDHAERETVPVDDQSDERVE